MHTHLYTYTHAYMHADSCMFTCTHTLLTTGIRLNHQLLFDQSTSVSILRSQIRNCCDCIVE